MKFRAQWSQIPTVVETCEAIIEAETSEEALQKFLEGDFARFLVQKVDKLDEPEVDMASIKWLKSSGKLGA